MFIIEQNGHKLYVPGQALLTSNLVGCANYAKITATSLEIMFFFQGKASPNPYSTLVNDIV